MKNFICMVLAVIVLVACAPAEPLYTPGAYTGIAEGYHSNLVVEVTTDEYKITSIEILEEDETPVISEIVYGEIPKAVIKANSTDVDVVAGATYTSETLLAAIENGLEKARIAIDASESEDEEKR